VYGPTETTIWSTSTRVEPGATDPLGIGGPIAGTTVHVLDDAGRDLPPGVVGELCVGGVGVARGYAGQPDLTARRFPTDPARGRYYRTGDLATWRTDGTIQLRGRTDRQVKLRGRRIELDEIEQALHRHDGVSAAAVVVRGDPQGDGRLIGYVQPTDPLTGADLDDIGRFVRGLLPHYLVPAELVGLDEMPRNASGKVDYRALPQVVASAPAPVTSTPSADPLTVALVDIWRAVLNRDDLGSDSNLFASGGHSLSAAIVAARVGEHTGLPVSLHDVLDAPTPAGLARTVRATGVYA
jgi:acyl-coenzyme A synthetase/AMP-(fatty) acid ligase